MSEDIDFTDCDELCDGTCEDCEAELAMEAEGAPPRERSDYPVDARPMYSGWQGATPPATDWTL